MEGRRVWGNLVDMLEILGVWGGGILTGGFRLVVREGTDGIFTLPRANFAMSLAFFSLAPLVRSFFLSVVSGCLVRISVLLKSVSPNFASTRPSTRRGVDFGGGLVSSSPIVTHKGTGLFRFWGGVACGLGLRIEGSCFFIALRSGKWSLESKSNLDSAGTTFSTSISSSLAVINPPLMAIPVNIRPSSQPGND